MRLAVRQSGDVTMYNLKSRYYELKSYDFEFDNLFKLLKAYSNSVILLVSVNKLLRWNCVTFPVQFKYSKKLKQSTAL